MNDVPALPPESGSSNDQFLGELRDEVLAAAERLSADEMLQREATRPDGTLDHELLDAIIERERKVDQVINGGVMDRHLGSDLSQAYQNAAKQVQHKKNEAGIDT